MFDLIPPDVCPDSDNVLKLHSPLTCVFFFFFLFYFYFFGSSFHLFLFVSYFVLVKLCSMWDLSSQARENLGLLVESSRVQITRTFRKSSAVFCLLACFWFLAVSHDLWNPSSLTRDWTQAPAVKAVNLSHRTAREFPRLCFDCGRALLIFPLSFSLGP